jgi:hypothetical protein
MPVQAKADRSLRLVLSGASADVTLVVSDAAERPVATMVVAPAQLREIVQSFGNILRMVEGEAASGALPVNAPWQKTGFVVDQPRWRTTRESVTGLVVMSLEITPGAWWSFTLSPEQALALGQQLGATIAAPPPAAAALPPVAVAPPGPAAAAPPEGAEAALPTGRRSTESVA